MKPEDIYISFSMHPLWAKTVGLNLFLKPLWEAGLRAVEFELDPHQEEWSEFESMIQICNNMNYHISFHAPYKRRYYSLEGFNRDKRDGVIDLYSPMLGLAQVWAQNNNHTIITVHGGIGINSTRQQLVEDTRAFLEWCLNEYPSLIFALENADISKKDEIKVCTDREEVCQLIQTINHSRLGICWDMGHDQRNGRKEAPQKEWMEHVVNVHIHDVSSEGVDHYPLIYNNVPINRWLPALIQTGYKGNLVLELKGKQMIGMSMEQTTEVLVKSIRRIQELVQ